MGRQYNSINWCAAGFHIREGRWLRNGRKIIEIIFIWLKGKRRYSVYSTWIADAVWDYCSVLEDYGFGTELLEELISKFGWWTKEHQRERLILVDR